MKQLGALLPDGRISSNINGLNMTFESPSAFRQAGFLLHLQQLRQLHSWLLSARPLHSPLNLSFCLCQGIAFSCSCLLRCCSIYLKRLVNPTRKADDGWKTVRYNSRWVPCCSLQGAKPCPCS